MDPKKTTILIVDDDDFLLNMYKTKFENQGYEVSCISSPAACLDKLRDGFSPDIILLDIIMPGFDGLEVLRCINKENLAKGSTIIMLTNQAESEDESIELGASGFIVKALAIPSEVVSKVSLIYKKRKK